MQYVTVNQTLEQIEADALVLGIYGTADGSEPRLPDLPRWQGTLGRTIRRLLALEELKTGPCELTSLLLPGGVAAPHVVLVGLGPPERISRRLATRAAATAARYLAARRRDKVAFFLDDRWPEPLREAAVAGATMGCLGQDLYKARPTSHSFAQTLWPECYAEQLPAGRILGQSINLARRLINEPPSQIYPETFADRAAQVAHESGMSVEIWDEERLRAEGCGALLAVGQGSVRPPRLVLLRYQPAPADKHLLALVGKGVTFDSGGLSLKSSENMLSMKCDMAGAATVLGAMQAICQLQLPINVLGVMGLAENMPGHNAFKLGDVVRTRNGTTIEIHNTDAEGRLVLADALSVARDHGATRIVDLATLTGACVIALGTDYTGLMVNQAPWGQAVKEAARRAGELVWELPMTDDFNEQVQGAVADLKNMGNGRWGGAITAAKLLEPFAGDCPWAHLDIAGPAFLEKPQSWLDAGASGVMVATLVELARQPQQDASV